MIQIYLAKSIKAVTYINLLIVSGLTLPFVAIGINKLGDRYVGHVIYSWGFFGTQSGCRPEGPACDVEMAAINLFAVAFYIVPLLVAVSIAVYLYGRFVIKDKNKLRITAKTAAIINICIALLLAILHTRYAAAFVTILIPLTVNTLYPLLVYLYISINRRPKVVN